MYLLKCTSIFLPLPRKKHHQICGRSVAKLFSDFPRGMPKSRAPHHPPSNVYCTLLLVYWVVTSSHLISAMLQEFDDSFPLYLWWGHKVKRQRVVKKRLLWGMNRMSHGLIFCNLFLLSHLSYILLSLHLIN